MFKLEIGGGSPFIRHAEGHRRVYPFSPANTEGVCSMNVRDLRSAYPLLRLSYPAKDLMQMYHCPTSMKNTKRSEERRVGKECW